MAGYNTNPYYPAAVGSFPYTNYQNTVPLSQPQQTQPGNILTVFVDKEEEVANYPVAAGTTVQLVSFNLNKFWLKSTSTNGVPEALREFEFKETTKTQPQANQNGVSREEFETLSKKIDKLIADLGGSSNG